MKILVTGVAGFIGMHVTLRLLNDGYEVAGIDNLNDYYDVNLKHSRLQHITNLSNFLFQKLDLADREGMNSLFSELRPDVVVNLAAQAGVRYSLESPHSYIESNVLGFLNVLECCKKHKVRDLFYASSSSVYGGNKKIPFSVSDKVDKPLSIYAASKKSNELMAYAYSHLFGFRTTGLRFFTVYGPWGRPDMAPFKFADLILNEKQIEVYNKGEHSRDFTYIDDVTDAISKMIRKSEQRTKEEESVDDEEGKYRVFNIGSNRPVKLMDFVGALEHHLGKTARKAFLPMQLGDVHDTWADISELEDDYKFAPNTSLDDGVKKFADWFKEYRASQDNFRAKL